VIANEVEAIRYLLEAAQIAVTIGFVLMPVRGYDKGCSPDNVEFVGIAA
jgi:hypothetical protein